MRVCIEFDSNGYDDKSIDITVNTGRQNNFSNGFLSKYTFYSNIKNIIDLQVVILDIGVWQIFLEGGEEEMTKNKNDNNKDNHNNNE